MKMEVTTSSDARTRVQLRRLGVLSGFLAVFCGTLIGPLLIDLHIFFFVQPQQASLHVVFFLPFLFVAYIALWGAGIVAAGAAIASRGLRQALYGLLALVLLTPLAILTISAISIWI